MTSPTHPSVREPFIECVAQWNWKIVYEFFQFGEKCTVLLCLYKHFLLSCAQQKCVILSFSPPLACTKYSLSGNLDHTRTLHLVVEISRFYSYVDLWHYSLLMLLCPWMLFQITIIIVNIKNFNCTCNTFRVVDWFSLMHHLDFIHCNYCSFRVSFEFSQRRPPRPPADPRGYSLPPRPPEVPRPKILNHPPPHHQNTTLNQPLIF